MLAVQQAPRMGSSQPPSGPFLPFGYAIDPNQEPLLDPPEPAPGAPLLSENDSRLLTSFFEDMTADHYNMPSFGEGLNFSDTWLDLPPQFMGSTTSFGQQPATSMVPHNLHGMHHAPTDFNPVLPMGHHSMPPPPPPPPQPHIEHRRASDDVLNAAATLVQNGSAHRHNSTGSDGSFQRRPVGPPVGHLRHQPLEEFREEGRKSLSTGDHEDTFTQWMWGPQGSQDRPQARSALPTDIQWGTDSSFNHVQGFTPNSERETAESLSKEQLKYLECLEPSQSADNTRPNSPNHGLMAPPSNPRLPDLVRRQQEAEAPPRKRRKSKNSKEAFDDEAEVDTNTPKTIRRRKTKSDRNGSISLPLEEPSAGKRRKSAANGTKPPRENLTEEQKRENHIKSEQKRRTLIKEGFDDLCNLVPGLRGGGFSKSTMLAMAADWLEELLRGNETLNSQLAGLEGRT